MGGRRASAGVGEGVGAERALSCVLGSAAYCECVPSEKASVT